MKSPPWVHQLALQDSSWKWRLLPWLCVQTCTLWPTRVSLVLEEPNSYVISLMELKSTFVLTSFKFLGRIAGWPTARTCLPFCSLIMKIMTLKGIHLPKDGMVLSRQGPISLYSLQSSKVHSSIERANKSPSKPPKSGSSSHASPIGKISVAPSVSKLPETSSPHNLEPQPSSTHSQPWSSIPHVDRMMTLMEGLHEHISEFANVMYSHNNHVQLRLTTIETHWMRLSASSRQTFSYLCQKGVESLLCILWIYHIVRERAPQSKGEYIKEGEHNEFKRRKLTYNQTT